MISNAKALTKRGGKMVLFNPSPLVRGALETAGLDHLIPKLNDYQNACEDLAATLQAHES